MKIKQKHIPFITPIESFTGADKEIIKKVLASIHIQETQYFVPSKSRYDLTWQEIFPVLLTPKESKSSLSYFLVRYGFNMSNDLQLIFEDIFDMPLPPEGLSVWNREHREKVEYKKYEEEYEAQKLEIIQDILSIWDKKKKKVIDYEEKVG